MGSCPDPTLSLSGYLVLNIVLNESSAIRRFEGSDAIKIRDGITFDFYTGLLHIILLPLMAMNFALCHERACMCCVNITFIFEGKYIVC